MTEKQLIRQLKQLRDIEPNKEWVLLTKKRIFHDEAIVEKEVGIFSFLPLFRYRLAFAPIVSVLIIIGLFGFVQNTIPGDFLFSVKKMTETAQVAFSSQTEKAGVHLKLANKRLEELSQIAESNQVKNLGPAIKEFQDNIAQAAKDLTGMEFDATSQNSTMLKEIVAETQKLQQGKSNVEAVLGTIIGDTEELTNAISQLEKQIAGYLIADLERRTLSEEDQISLREAIQDFEEGEYAEALEKIWLLSNN